MRYIRSGKYVLSPSMYYSCKQKPFLHKHRENNMRQPCLRKYVARGGVGGGGGGGCVSICITSQMVEMLCNRLISGAGQGSGY